MAFAPVKKARTDFIVEKAVEAAEQCGGLSVPEVAEPVALGAMLDRWDPGRRILRNNFV